jgi:hypothetical protein
VLSDISSISRAHARAVADRNAGAAPRRRYGAQGRDRPRRSRAARWRPPARRRRGARPEAAGRRPSRRRARNRIGGWMAREGLTGCAKQKTRTVWAGCNPSFLAPLASRGLLLADHQPPRLIRRWQRRTNVWREVTSPAPVARRLTSDRKRSAISCANAFGVHIHETLRSPSCSRARFRSVGLACRARLHVAAVHIVVAEVCRN